MNEENTQPGDGATPTSRVVANSSWKLSVPDFVTADSPLVCVPTIHPRGDQRVLRCAQVALNSGFRVRFLWPGSGEASLDHAISEVLVPPADSFRERISLIGALARAAAEDSPSLWHIHDFYFLGSARRWQRRSGLSVIYDVHEYYSTYYAEKLPIPNFARRWVERALERHQVRTVKAVGGANVVAAAMARPYEAEGLLTAVSPNFPLREPYANAANLPGGSRCNSVIHTGTLSEPYGMQILVELAALARDAGSPTVIDVIERFPNASQRRRFEDLRERADNPPGLRLIPAVPAHEIPGLISTYRVGLSTLLDGGQNDLAVPTKLYEYVLCGLAIVGTDRNAQRQFLETWSPDGSAVFDQSDVRGMFTAIESLLQPSTALSKSLQHSADEAARALFWEESSAKSLAALYAQLWRRGGNTPLPVRSAPNVPE